VLDDSEPAAVARQATDARRFLELRVVAAVQAVPDIGRLRLLALPTRQFRARSRFTEVRDPRVELFPFRFERNDLLIDRSLPLPCGAKLELVLVHLDMPALTLMTCENKPSTCQKESPAMSGA
jgi:hypothetical protein